MYSLVTTWN